MGRKLQIKERDKPTKMGHLHDEEERKKLALGDGVEAAVESALKTMEREKKIAFLKGVLEPSDDSDDVRPSPFGEL